MDIQIIDYKKVKCPKCGKSYFRVKENSGVSFTTLIFTTKPDPIYKDGELQNPTEDEPIKVRCECLDCGCNFRVETHNVFGEYRFIDEDEERKENERKLAESFKMLRKEAEKFETKNQTLVDLPLQVSKTIKVDKTSFAIKTYQEVVEEEIDEIKERLAKLESVAFNE